jgi:hypothetical protein
MNKKTLLVGGLVGGVLLVGLIYFLILTMRNSSNNNLTGPSVPAEWGSIIVTKIDEYAPSIHVTQYSSGMRAAYQDSAKKLFWAKEKRIGSCDELGLGHTGDDSNNDSCVSYEEGIYDVSSSRSLTLSDGKSVTWEGFRESWNPIGQGAPAYWLTYDAKTQQKVESLFSPAGRYTVMDYNRCNEGGCTTSLVSTDTGAELVQINDKVCDFFPCDYILAFSNNDSVVVIQAASGVGGGDAATSGLWIYKDGKLANIIKDVVPAGNSLLYLNKNAAPGYDLMKDFAITDIDDNHITFTINRALNNYKVGNYQFDFLTNRLESI